MHAVRIVIAAIVILAAYGESRARPPKPTPAKRPALSAREEKAVATCLEIIRGCQLPDGAFVQVNHGGNPDSPVWIAPYFADHAALALIAGHEHRKASSDLRRVGRWLEWRARNQTRDGYWNDFEGTVSAYRNNGKVDAWDSSAAMFLLVAGRHRSAGGETTPAVMVAARRALNCIGKVGDSDGLTSASPTYKVKFLMDNVEVYAGLRAAAGLFNAAGASAEARKASDRADLIARRLPAYWRPADGLFAYALHPKGSFEVGLVESYPHGLAQLFGIGFIAPKAEAWAAIGTLLPDRGPTAAAGVERWLVAASRLAGEEEKRWRARVVDEVATFTTLNVHIYRPGVAALALLEGADWMPSVAGGESVKRLHEDPASAFQVGTAETSDGHPETDSVPEVGLLGEHAIVAAMDSPGLLPTGGTGDIRGRTGDLEGQRGAIEFGADQAAADGGTKSLERSKRRFHVMKYKIGRKTGITHLRSSIIKSTEEPVLHDHFQTRS